jgi:hypothetical protein
MAKENTVTGMPRGEGTKQIGFSAKELERAVYKDAAARMHLRNTSDFLRIAAEEKLLREFPDLFKRIRG